MTAPGARDSFSGRARVGTQASSFPVQRSFHYGWGRRVWLGFRKFDAGSRQEDRDVCQNKWVLFSLEMRESSPPLVAD